VVVESCLTIGLIVRFGKVLSNFPQSGLGLTIERLAGARSRVLLNFLVEAKTNHAG
jgi:hypothetical protein